MFIKNDSAIWPVIYNIKFIKFDTIYKKKQILTDTWSIEID